MSAFDIKANPRLIGLRIARQAFLYGEGDGDPVLNLERLEAISGVRGKTIRAHMVKWVEEREEMIVKREESALGYHLSGKTIKNHEADVEFLRKECNNLKTESDSLKATNKKLLELLQDIGCAANFSEEDSDRLTSLAQSYFKSSNNRQKVLGLFLTIQKRWQESSGMSSQLKAWETGQREQAKGAAKVEAKRKELEMLKDGELEIVSTPALGVFARTGSTPPKNEKSSPGS